MTFNVKKLCSFICNSFTSLSNQENVTFNARVCTYVSTCHHFEMQLQAVSCQKTEYRV